MLYEVITLFHPGTYDKDSMSSLNKDREKDIEKIEYLNSLIKNKGVSIITYNDIEIIKNSS